MHISRLWVGLSCVVLVVAAPCAQLCAETLSEDATPATSEAQAKEIPLLEVMTFREAGQPMPRAYLGAGKSSSRPGSGSWTISRMANAEITLDREHSSYSSENQLYNLAFPPDPLGPRPRYLLNGIPTWAEEELSSSWDIEGEIGFVSGSSTYVNNDGHFFKLSETLTTKSGNEFEFYQEYGVDHSYYNSRELVIGAQQDFDSFWLNGGLRLTEEFTDYKDIGYSDNNRQTGLFKLRFDPRTEDGSWKGLFDYRYNVKTYDVFSTRSYILHSAKFKLDYPLGSTVSGQGRVRFDHYNYSIGSTRSNNRLSYGNTLTWEPNNSIKVTAAVDKDRKQYGQKKDRSYEKQTYQTALRWKPDSYTMIDLKGSITDYDRALSLDRSYEDKQLELRLQRDLSSKLDLEARFVERQKDYDLDPLDGLDTHRRKVGLNYNANRNWNFGISWDETQYDYALLARAYQRNVYTLDGTYSHGGLRLGGGWRATKSDYSLDPLRDYTRYDYDVDADWRFGLHRLRVYFGVADFSQADPASVNGYLETRYGAGWSIELSSKVDLKIDFDSSKRAYDTRDNLRNDRLFAKLSFEL